MFGYDSLAGSAVISLPAFRVTFGRPYDGDYVVDANWQLGFQAATLGGEQSLLSARVNVLTLSQELFLVAS